MGLESLVHIRKALNALNPNEVREMSKRKLRIALHAASQESYGKIENFFLSDLSPERRRQSALMLTRAPVTQHGQEADLSIYDEGVMAPTGALIFRSGETEELVKTTLARHHDLGVGLASSFHPFRGPFVQRVIAKVARENTLFSITTALPDIIPNVIELPWAIAEFASDTAFLTMNQVRMAFVIAGASDREVGYLEQKSEIATVVGSAFGWRALAKQLVGKVPFGGGLIGKAAVAYAGTKVLGLSLERFYSIGYSYTREERDRVYADAFRQGKKVAWRILGNLRPDLAAKFGRQSSKTDESQGRAAAS